MNTDILNRLYENLRIICYQLPNFLSDFENEFTSKTDLDRKVLDTVKEAVKGCMSVTFDSTELIYNLLNAEDDLEVQEIIRMDDGRLD